MLRPRTTHDRAECLAQQMADGVRGGTEELAHNPHALPRVRDALLEPPLHIVGNRGMVTPLLNRTTAREMELCKWDCASGTVQVGLRKPCK